MMVLINVHVVLELYMVGMMRARLVGHIFFGIENNNGFSLALRLV